MNKLIYLLPLIFLLGSCDKTKHFMEMYPDSPMEQYAERVVETVTGVDVDFTPEVEKE